MPLNIGLMVTGLSNPAPLDLAVIGMPGCHLRVSAESLMTLIGANNQATYDLSLPSNPSLVGVALYQQALVFDSGAGNAFQAVISEAPVAVIGQ